MAKHRRKDRNSGFRDAVSLITSFALIVIAVLMVVFVYIYIKNNTGGLPAFPGKPAESTAEQETKETEEMPEQGSDPFEIDVANDSYGLYEDPEEGVIFILSPEHSPLYADQNKKRLSDGRMILVSDWVEFNGRLYHFDENGHITTGRMSEGAMNYAFDERGMLTEIRCNPSYRPQTGGNAAEYPGLVQTKNLWAFLNEQKSLAGLPSIMYKKTTDSLSHQLGGSENPQYTSPNTMTISGGYIYYLPVFQQTDALTEKINKKLFRMRPGDTVRQKAVGADNVEGYKILELADGSSAIYVDDGTYIVRIRDFEEDNTVITFSEDAHYYVEIRDGGSRAVLMLEGGIPVSMETDSFAVNNFTYSLASDGTIRSVKNKNTVSWNGYTYSIETGDAFGLSRSRIVRINNQTGDVEVISSEFPGSGGNLHYDYAGGRMFAEYRDEHGFAGLLKISMDGDVDYLEDAARYDGTITMIGFQDQLVLVHGISSAEDKFVGLRMNASVPLAVAVDPALLEADDPDPASLIETDTAGPGEQGTQTGPGGPAGPGDLIPTTAQPEEYDEAVAGPPPSEVVVETEGGQAEVSAGPGAYAPGQDAPVVYSPPGGNQIGPGGQAPGEGQ